MTRTVLTLGTFDCFHAGHVNFLRQCRAIAGDNGEVVVGLNRDEFVFRYKNAAPIMTYGERDALVSACRYVDTVVLNRGDEDAKPTIADVEPDFLVIGSDWAQKDYYAQLGLTQRWLDGLGVHLLYVPYTEGISSTEVKARVLRA